MTVHEQSQGDVLLVADQFDDGWMRGLRLEDLEVGVPVSILPFQ